MKRLILHIGMSKTGTTTIRNTLANSTELLFSRGIYYFSKQTPNHSLNFVPIFSDNPAENYYFINRENQTSEFVQNEIEKMKNTWITEFTKDFETMIISADSLSRYNKNEITKMKAFLEPYFNEIKVIVYVRHPSSSIVSQWQQKMRLSDSLTSEAQVLQSVKEKFNYSFLNEWINAFGLDNTIIRLFDKTAFIDGDLLKDFIISANLKELNNIDLPPVLSNESLGQYSVSFLTEFNKKYPVYKNNKINRERGLVRRINIFYELLSNVSKTPKLDFEVTFTKEEAERINKEINYVNQFLDKKFEPVNWSDKETVFPNYQEIPIDYFIELINNYNLYIDELMGMRPSTDNGMQNAVHLSTIKRLYKRYESKLPSAVKNIALKINNRILKGVKMYLKELEVAKKLAIEAGKRIMEIYESEFDVMLKADQSPLTIADQEANQIIVSGLQAEFPNYAILSEESKDDKSRLKNDYCFIVDPIDGTKEFIKRNGQFTVNIGLAYKHKVVMGVIYVPVSKELYYASAGQGAIYIKLDANDEPLIQKSIKVSDKNKDLILVGSKSHTSQQLDTLISTQHALIKDIRSAGSSLKGCLVACGDADVYYRFGYTCEWDTCAMQCIVEEAGGIFKQMNHSEMRYNRENNLNEFGFYAVNRASNIWV